MISAELQTAVESIGPKLEALAGDLGQNPGDVLCALVDQKQKELALGKLDEMVEQAEASGFAPIASIDEYFAEVKAEAHRRNAHRL
ncbi:MAG: hypothetical protein IZT59_08515 [Verrucomicrobia bacterium]|nr:hypothetical protein [Verrucomicrobiota bacterium]|tara:strand:+ start:29692 stop:29949 length:258 start_codon:yes stop_codon:yes gene_type:complete